MKKIVFLVVLAVLAGGVGFFSLFSVEKGQQESLQKLEISIKKMLSEKNRLENIAKTQRGNVKELLAKDDKEGAKKFLEKAREEEQHVSRLDEAIKNLLTKKLVWQKKLEQLEKTHTGKPAKDGWGKWFWSWLGYK